MLPCLSARLAEKNDPVEFHHHIRRQRGGQRDHRSGHRDQHIDVGVGQARRQQKRLQQQPFRNKAIERRQAGYGQHTDQHQHRDPRHVMDQPAHAPHVALAGSVQN